MDSKLEGQGVGPDGPKQQGRRRKGEGTEGVTRKHGGIGGI